MYKLPTLSYSFDALEPYIDKRTMEIHYTKHHQVYTDKLNAVLEKYPQFEKRKIEDLLENLSTLKMDDKDKLQLNNNGGGYLNHSFFWSIMGKNKTLDSKLIERIKQKYLSLEKFKELFAQTAIGHFGSGWIWLVETKNGNLDIYSTPNQDSPYLKGDKPLLTLDVWEHAYYLLYQNRRVEYITNWWNVLKLL
jgi:superoxide dismutase, Fe-Mn family